MKRRIITLLLVLSMICSMLPLTALAAEEWDGGTFDNGLTWSIDYEGNLTITGSGPMESNPWALFSNEIVNVVIGDGITSIPEMAFSECSNLETVSIPDSVVEIGEYAFNGCYSLKSVTIPNGVTEIKEKTFYNCESMESVTISDSLTKIGPIAFGYCRKLTSVSLPDGVTEIGESAFAGCSSLTAVVLPKGLTVLNDYVFSNCASLKKVVLPEGLQEIKSYAFRYCGELSDINFPDSITAMGEYAFADTALTHVRLPQDLTTIGNDCFYWCDALRYVVIPAGVTEIGDYAFGNTDIDTLVFEGNAPAIGANAFRNLYATAFYPAGNETWTADVMTKYGASRLNWTDVSVASISVEDMYIMEATSGYGDGEGYFKYNYYPTITITLTDGTVYETTNRSLEINDISLPVILLDDQSKETPWGVGDHQVTACFGQAQTSFTVTITESDVAGFEIPDMILTAGVDGETRGEYDAEGNWVPDAWVYYDVRPDTFTLHYKDGTSVTDSTDNFGYQYDTWLYTYDGQNSENQWGVGTYTVTAEFMNMFCDYQVTIQEFPIERIEVAPVVLTQGVDGYWNEYDNDGNWLGDKWFEYSVWPEVITVYYTDGTTLTGSRWEIQDATGFNFTWTTDQDYDNQWGVGTHTATAALEGITCEFQVIIQESPVDRIEVAPLTKEAYVDGRWRSYWDDELEQRLDYTWFYYNVAPETMTVYYKDGTVISGTAEQIQDQTGYGVEYSSTQSIDNQWGPGKHTATVTFMGIACDYEVIIKECPVERIEVAPVVVQAYTNGTWQSTWDDEIGDSIENTWFLYCTPAQTVTVYYKDGTTLTGTPEEIYEKTGARVECDYESAQSSNTPWGVGTYTAIAHYMGTSFEYQVVVEENPVERIEVAPLTLVEKASGSWRGYWDENDEWVSNGWFKYDTAPAFMTLYMKDGTTQSGTMEELEELYGCDHSSTSDQSAENQWGIGTYTATANFMNLTCDYQVTIVENPVDRIEVAPITLHKDIDGYMDSYWESGEEYKWFRYDTRPEQVTVYFKDGTVVSGTPEEIWEQTGQKVTWEDDQDYWFRWSKTGTYSATAKFLGCTYEYEVTIVDAPAKDYTVTYTSASISLAGDIGVNYYAKLSDDVIADPGAYMQFTVAGQTQTVPLNEAVVSTDANGVTTYRFSCKVAAKQMTEQITGQLYLADGTAVGEAKVYSVKAYCDAAIPYYSQSEAYADLVGLMKAMLNYGGYSQVHFGYNTENLANAGLDLALPELTAADVDAYAHGATGSESGIRVASVSLLLESTTTIRFYFELDGTKSIDAYTFFVDGVETAPVAGENGQYYVDKVGVAAKDLDEMVTVTVGGLTAKYCGLSYVRQVAVLYPSYYNANLVNVAKALYAYNQAANAHFA